MVDMAIAVGMFSEEDLSRTIYPGTFYQGGKACRIADKSPANIRVMYDRHDSR